MEPLEERQLNPNNQLLNQLVRKKNNATEATQPATENVQKSKPDEKPEVKQQPEPLPNNLTVELELPIRQVAVTQTIEQEPAIEAAHIADEHEIRHMTAKAEEEKPDVIENIPEVAHVVYTQERVTELSANELATTKATSEMPESEAEPRAVDSNTDLLNEHQVITEVEGLYQDLSAESAITATTHNFIEAEINEELELLFETETIETYQELMALTNGAVASEASSADPAEIDISSSTELETDIETSASSNFKELVLSLPQEAVSLEAIQERLAEQPIEQTLVQLARYLAEPTPEPMQQTLAGLVEDIKEALSTCYVTDKTGEVKLQITPEMTEKLLALVGALGYENPREELVTLVAQHGTDYLFDALKYICRFNEFRPEILLASAATTTTDDSSTQQRFGKIILRIIQRYTNESRALLQRAV